MSVSRKLVVGLPLALCVWAMSSVSAMAGVITWSFNYAGVGTTLSGMLTTSDTPNPAFVPTAYDILGITGTRNGIPIAGIVPPSGAHTIQFGFPYDNVLYASEPYFDIEGLLYQTLPGTMYNVWFENNQYWEGYYTSRNAFVSTALTEGGIERVPEPGALALVGLALAFLGLVAGRRRQSP